MSKAKRALHITKRTTKEPWLYTKKRSKNGPDLVQVKKLGRKRVMTLNRLAGVRMAMGYCNMEKRGP